MRVSLRRAGTVSNVSSRHRKTHDRPYHCAFCPEAFALRSDLNRHVTCHEHVRTIFRCLWQGCSFRGTIRKDNLLKHMKRAHSRAEGLDLGPEERAKNQENVQQLYKKSVQQNPFTEKRKVLLALYEAVNIGDESMVLAQLEAVADLSVKIEYAGAALTAAARRGHKAIVRLLLEQGADIESKDGQNDKALTTAARGTQGGYLTASRTRRGY